MTQKIKEQILAIRETGLTNMFDVNMVQRLAYERDFYELVNYLEEHRKEYVRFIMTGEEESITQFPGRISGAYISRNCLDIMCF